jgi:hypothetical protein
MFATAEHAEREARRRPRLGSFIAEVVLTEDIRVERTGRKGHHTVWGDPARLVASVVRVMPVDYSSVEGHDE